MGLRFAIAAAALVALVGIFTAHNANMRREGELKERARVETEGRKIDAKARAAKRAVAQSPADRVLDPWYRD